MAQAEFLDSLLPDILAQWRHYVAVLKPQPGEKILDVGCGTGDTERLLVRDHPGIGRVIGIDNDSLRIERARERCRDEEGDQKIAFQEADAHELPFPDASFDKALCVETVEYFADPLRGLAEIRRVLRPGGAALIVHTDWDTQVYTAPDKELSRRVLHAFTDAGPNGQIGRHVMALCRQSGFRQVEPSVYVLLHESFAPSTYANRAAELVVDWLLKVEALPEGDLRRWFTGLQEQAERGEFFYSINRYLCLCRA